MGRRIR
jgi:hypothetical protein